MAFYRPGMAKFEVRVNDVDMLVGADMLKDLSIIENAVASLPTVTLTFLDNKRAANSFGLFVDGAPIEVLAGDGKDSENKYKFRQWSLSDATTNTAGDLVTLSGVADAMKWFRKYADKPYKGSSSDAIKKLAQDGGLNRFEGESCQDDMTWLPDGRTLCQLARTIADHSWAGDGKSPMMAVTSDKGQWMLRFKDILKQGQGGGRKFVSAGLDKPNDIIIWDYRIFSDSMFNNALRNYGYEVIQENLKGDQDIFKDMNISKMSSNMGINSNVKGMINTVQQFFHPPAIGNTHNDFVKAKHHNAKARAAFSTTVHIMTDEMTDTKLLDDVEIKLARSGGEVDEAYSGTYKVSGITRHISRGSYREKLVLISQGTSTSAFGGGV